jgi:hypothetical protein
MMRYVISIEILRGVPTAHLNPFIGCELNDKGTNPPGAASEGGLLVAVTGAEANAHQVMSVVTAYIAENPGVTLSSDLRPLEERVKKVIDMSTPYAYVSRQPSPAERAEIDAAFEEMENGTDDESDPLDAVDANTW